MIATVSETSNSVRSYERPKRSFHQAVFFRIMRKLLTVSSSNYSST